MATREPSHVIEALQIEHLKQAKIDEFLVL